MPEELKSTAWRGASDIRTNDKINLTLTKTSDNCGEAGIRGTVVEDRQTFDSTAGHLAFLCLAGLGPMSRGPYVCSLLQPVPCRFVTESSAEKVGPQNKGQPAARLEYRLGVLRHAGPPGLFRLRGWQTGMWSAGTRTQIGKIGITTRRIASNLARYK